MIHGVNSPYMEFLDRWRDGGGIRFGSLEFTTSDQF